MNRVVLCCGLVLWLGSGCGASRTAQDPSGGGGAAGGAPSTGGAGGSTPDGRGGSTMAVLDPGAPVDVTVPAALTEAARQEHEALEADRPADPAAFAARWPSRFASQLGYDPLAAQGMDKIGASLLGLSAGERDILGRNGFVISARQTFPTFFYGYKAIYADHLPLFVSIDSVMHAVHRSYDKVLASIELGLLVPRLTTLLAAMHAQLASGAGGGLSVEVRSDVDLYLTVARRLLGVAATPVAGASPSAVDAIVGAATAATGTSSVDLFGERREVDFTQFTLRGHYDQYSGLAPYFRAMMWLGRTDLRFLQYDTFAGPTAPPKFHRRQFLDGLLLAMLSADSNFDGWREIDQVLKGFVGESDNMTVADFGRLQTLLGTASIEAIAALPDQQLAQTLLDGGFGIQRIASQILFVPPGGGGVPLDRVMLLFGQRFVIDSEVLSYVVFDRVRGEPERTLPNPLDVAFGALGNNAAAGLLATELATYPDYPRALHEARKLVDAHEDAFWGSSLYGNWLSALRGLSPAGGDATAGAGLPSVAKTEAWSRRLLNAQLASWAELRHDTLLYSKQSYTAVPLCDFPDAYVDPYPEAWDALVRFARFGQSLAASLPTSTSWSPDSIVSYFDGVEATVSTLKGMAEAERAGQPLTAEQMAFINQTVEETTTSGGCVPTTVQKGWYVKLFFERASVTKTDPTIADVHSAPGEMKILHAGTGLPRLMVVTADGCSGPRAYVGLASSYYEKTTTDYTRLDDATWAGQVMQAPDVPWMSSLIAR
jgi:hypothetical protein